jgi:hypothetical protein
LKVATLSLNNGVSLDIDERTFSLLFGAIIEAACVYSGEDQRKLDDLINPLNIYNHELAMGNGFSKQKV